MYRGVANMPGPGGSLGMCALCGEGFMFEILMGQRVQMVEIVGMDKDVCLHAKCMAVLEKNGTDWRTLPEGPLRRAYEKATTTNAVDPSAQPQESRLRATAPSSEI